MFKVNKTPEPEFFKILKEKINFLLGINPTLEDPQDYLTYDIKTGQVIPKEIIGAKYKKLGFFRVY